MKTTTKLLAAGAALALGGVLVSCATVPDGPSDAEIQQRALAIMKTDFAKLGPVWAARIDQDEVQALCTKHHTDLPKDVATKIETAQLATIQYPAPGKFIGDWKKGEAIAQEGRGMQFSDVAGAAAGGNCYACHQISPKEISFGNIGPSLLAYGKLRGNSEAIVRYTWGKVYNAEAYSACSNMPRFGHAKILTPEQISDVVALLLDPASPVNQ